MDLFGNADSIKRLCNTYELLDSSGDEELSKNERGCSLSGKSPNVNRERRQIGDLLCRQ